MNRPANDNRGDRAAELAARVGLQGFTQPPADAHPPQAARPSNRGRATAQLAARLGLRGFDHMRFDPPAATAAQAELAPEPVAAPPVTPPPAAQSPATPPPMRSATFALRSDDAGALARLEAALGVAAGSGETVAGAAVAGHEIHRFQVAGNRAALRRAATTAGVSLVRVA